MKKTPFIYKILAFVLVVAFTFQSLYSINSHTYKTGLSNYHTNPFIKMSCLGLDLNYQPHYIKDCGKSFHL